MLDMLLEIQSLFESGAHEDALDLLQLYLDAHPHAADGSDPQDRLLSGVEKCYDEFVGRTLIEVDPTPRRAGTHGTA